MNTRLVTVHAGPLWEVQLLQGYLEEQGIASFIPDESTKRVDPFLTGANPLAADLQVPAEQAQRAVEVLERHREAAEEREAGIPPHHPPSATEGEILLGRRIRWASILWVTAPLAIVLGIVYLWRLKPGVARPRSHKLTVAAILLAIPLSLVLVFMLGLAFGYEWDWLPWIHEAPR